MVSYRWSNAGASVNGTSVIQKFPFLFINVTSEGSFLICYLNIVCSMPVVKQSKMNAWPWRWKHYSPFESQELLAQWHSITSLKTGHFSNTIYQNIKSWTISPYWYLNMTHCLLVCITSLDSCLLGFLAFHQQSGLEFKMSSVYYMNLSSVQPPWCTDYSKSSAHRWFALKVSIWVENCASPAVLMYDVCF